MRKHILLLGVSWLILASFNFSLQAQDKENTLSEEQLYSVVEVQQKPQANYQSLPGQYITQVLPQMYPEINKYQVKADTLIPFAVTSPRQAQKRLIFKANFSIEGHQFKVRFDKLGNWEQTDVELDIQNLPEKVVYALKNSKFKSSKVEEASYQETPLAGLYRLYVAPEISYMHGHTLEITTEGKIAQTIYEE